MVKERGTYQSCREFCFHDIQHNGESAIYEGAMWRIYDVSLGAEISSAINVWELHHDGSCRRETALRSSSGKR